jgi:hypothetical protein
MQLKPLLLTSLLFSAPALSSPSFQDEKGLSAEVIELSEQVRAQAEQARANVDLLLQQVDTAQAGAAATRILLAPPVKETTEQDPDRGYLGIQMSIENGVMIVAGVMPGSGADKAGLEAGDRISRINKINLAKDGAAEKLANLKAGKTAKVTFERDGQIQKVDVKLRPLSALDEGEEQRIELNPIRNVTVEVGQDEGKLLERRVRVLAPKNVDVRVDSPEGLARALKRGAAGGQIMFFGPGEGPESKTADHDEAPSRHEVLLQDGPEGRRVRLPSGQEVEIHFQAGHSESNPGQPHGRAVLKVLSDGGEEHVMEFELDGHGLEGLPDHLRELLKEHGGDGERMIRMRMERTHEGDDEEHDVHVLRLGDGSGTWIMRDGDNAPEGQRRARVEVFSGQGDLHIMNREIGVDMKGLPEHIRERIKEHLGDGARGAHGIFIIDDESDGEHSGHDAEEHELHVLRFGGGGGRDLRFGDDREFHVEIEVEHDGHSDHDGPEVSGRAIIKILTGNGNHSMEFDFDGADLREMGGRVLELMGGRDFDLRDIMARIRGDRGNRNDRSERDFRGLHREADHNGRGERDPRGLHREQDHGMGRPRAFGGGRGMGMMRIRGQGRPDMFLHEDHDDDDGDYLEGLEERIEELEARIGELEELLERVRGRRGR